MVASGREETEQLRTREQRVTGQMTEESSSAYSRVMECVGVGGVGAGQSGSGALASPMVVVEEAEVVVVEVLDSSSGKRCLAGVMTSPFSSSALSGSSGRGITLTCSSSSSSFLSSFPSFFLLPLPLRFVPITHQANCSNQSGFIFIPGS